MNSPHGKKVCNFFEKKARRSLVSLAYIFAFVRLIVFSAALMWYTSALIGSFNIENTRVWMCSAAVMISLLVVEVAFLSRYEKAALSMFDDVGDAELGTLCGEAIGDYLKSGGKVPNIEVEKIINIKEIDDDGDEIFDLIKKGKIKPPKLDISRLMKGQDWKNQ